MQATYHAIILGGIWWPMGAICSTEQTFTAESDEDAIEMAETTQAGDFSRVDDTYITRQDHCGQRSHPCLQCQYDSPYCPYMAPPVVVKDWSNEGSEMAYIDTLGLDSEDESA